MNSKREAYVSVLKDAIQDEKSTEEEVGVLRDIFEVHRVRKFETQSFYRKTFSFCLFTFYIEPSM